MRTLGTVAVISAALVLGGCEKDKSGLSSKQSGTLRPSESTLLHHVPGGNVALFGGNYMRLQDYFQRGPFAKLMGQVEQMVPGMTAWVECFTERDASKMQMIGAVSYRGDALEMTYVMKGFGIEDVERCARKANFESTIDPDGKYIATKIPSPLVGEQVSAYLQLEDGALFTRQAMPFPPTGAVTPATRADLEAAAASAKRSSAVDDEALVAESRLIDRDRAVWFVADLSKTPLGTKVGKVRGWMDVGSGSMSVDFNVQVLDRDAAAKAAEGIAELKKNIGMVEKHMGGELADIIRAIRFEQKGDRLRFAIKMTDAQMEAMMSQLPMGAMGAGMGGGGGLDY